MHCLAKRGGGSGARHRAVVCLLALVSVALSVALAADAASAANNALTWGGASPLVEALPTVSGILPSDGLPAGGEPIAITGTGLLGATAVHFGAHSVSFTVHSDTSITAVSPPETLGEEGFTAVPLTVTTPGGTSEVVNPLTDTFVYVEAFPHPLVERLIPKNGPAAGATTVGIIGQGFDSPVDAVDFGSTPAISFKQVEMLGSVGLIEAVAPPGTTGKVLVSVTTPAGTSVAGKKTDYQYEKPTVTALSPSVGPIAGGTNVTVTGTGFAPGTIGTSFEFGKAPASSVDCTSTTTCTAVSPAGRKAGSVDVVAVVGMGGKGKKNPPADQFTYN